MLELAAAVIASGVAAGAVRSIGVWLGQAPGRMTALAILAGYLVGHVGIHGAPPWVPAEVIDWLVPLAILSGGIGIVGNDGKTRALMVVRFALAVAATLVLLRARAQHVFTFAQSVLWFSVSIALLAGLWTAMDGWQRRIDARVGLAALLVLAAVSAAILVLSGLLFAGLATGSLAASLAGVLLVGWVFRQPLDCRSATPMTTLLLTAQWLIAFHYGEMPLAAFVVLAAIPAAVYVAGKRSRARLPLVAMVVLTLAAATITAESYFAPRIAGGDDYGYR